MLTLHSITPNEEKQNPSSLPPYDDKSVVVGLPDRGITNPLIDALMQGRPRLIYMAFRRVRDYQMAEDVFQDAVEKACRFDWSKIDDFTHYAARMICNMAVNYANRNRKVSGFSDYEYETVHDKRAPDPSQAIVDEERSKRLHDAMDHLSAKPKEVAEAFYFDGLKIKKIADELKIPLGTVKRILWDVRRRLAARLAEDTAMAL